MGKSWLLCILLGTLAWGQAAPVAPTPPQGPGREEAAKPPAPPTQESTAADVAPTAPVITIEGVCPPQRKTTAASATAKTGVASKTATASKTSAADCKTVITKAEFEKIISALSPTNPLTPPQRRQLANNLGRFISMSDAAKKRGLDQTPQYKETVKFLQMQILSRELTQSIQEEAAKVPQDEIEKYYKDHLQNFQQFSLDRLFVPRTKQIEPAAKEDEKDEKAEKLSEEAQKEKAEEAVKAMAELADSLRARAAAGEDLVKLQKEAFEAAGMKVESPTVNIPAVRRSGLSQAHAAVFDLKPGEVSQVISDAGGHYIYKMKSEEQLPLDKVENEIRNTLQSERMRAMMDKVTNSFKVETNEAYFGAGGPGMAPPQRMMSPRPAPSPSAPAAQPQSPPSAQPPAAAKPN